MNLDEQYKICDSSRFQRELAEFIIKNNLKTIVETGLGVSTVCILKAFDDANFDGRLYSIDPSPWYAHKISHPKLLHIPAKSIEVMKDLYLQTGQWDLFLHDGNHDILCQTYEYEFAFACLKQNGWLCSDDVNWGNNNAWNSFLFRSGLASEKLGAIDIVQKKQEALLIDAEEFHNKCLIYATEQEAEYLASGNKLTPIFQ